MHTKEDFEQSTTQDRFTISATPKDLIIRCVSIDNRKILDQLFRTIGLDLDKVKMTVVYSDEEWKDATDGGKKCYLFCSMKNFKFIGNNGFIYASGPVHKEYYIYNDKNNNSNALIAFDFVLSDMPKFEKEDNRSNASSKYEEDYLYHPTKLAKGANPPQLPRYNKETGQYELKCSQCGKWLPEKEVSYTYSRKTGYVYSCNKCNPSKFNFKSLSYKEKLAKFCQTDLDEYSFDGSN